MALALRRIAGLERRAGVHVDRVMAAPHERCSPVTTEAMLQLGFEALIIDRANPWRFRPEEEKPLAGWELAELVSGGLPVIRREHLSVSREDLILRAFLGQPLVLYGHHDDLSEGPDRLAALAEEIDRLGDVRWTSLGEIARTNYLHRRDGSPLDGPDAVQTSAAAGAGGRLRGIGRDASGVAARPAGRCRLAARRRDGSGTGATCARPRTPVERRHRRRRHHSARGHSGREHRPPQAPVHGRCLRRLIAEGRDRAQTDRAQHRAEVQRDGRLLYPTCSIIGAAKCGTTSLHFYLDQHPDVFMARPDRQTGRPEGDAPLLARRLARAARSGTSSTSTPALRCEARRLPHTPTTRFSPMFRDEFIRSSRKRS